MDVTTVVMKDIVIRPTASRVLYRFEAFILLQAWCTCMMYLYDVLV